MSSTANLNLSDRMRPIQLKFNRSVIDTIWDSAIVQLPTSQKRVFTVAVLLEGKPVDRRDNPNFIPKLNVRDAFLRLRFWSS